MYKQDVVPSYCFGADPELDEFMVSFSSLFFFSDFCSDFLLFLVFLLKKIVFIFRKRTAIYW